MKSIGFSTIFYLLCSESWWTLPNHLILSSQLSHSILVLKRLKSVDIELYVGNWHHTTPLVAFGLLGIVPMRIAMTTLIRSALICAVRCLREVEIVLGVLAVGTSILICGVTGEFGAVVVLEGDTRVLEVVLAVADLVCWLL